MNTNDRIVALCAGINGATMRYIADAIGIKIDNASGRLGLLQRQGRVLKVRPPGKGAKCVFHAVPGSTRRPVGRPPASAAPRSVAHSLTRHGKREVDPPVRLSLRGKLVDTQPIITAATKYTFQAAPVDRRYQVAPGDRVPAIFRGVPGLDPLTGRPWA